MLLWSDFPMLASEVRDKWGCKSLFLLKTWVFAYIGNCELMFWVQFLMQTIQSLFNNGKTSMPSQLGSLLLDS